MAARSRSLLCSGLYMTPSGSGLVSSPRPDTPMSVELADTIVPDFPLANTSFNLSCAENDL